MVLARLIEIYNTPCSISRYEWKTVARLTKRLKIPDAMTGEMLVIAPHINHSVALLWYVVYIAFVD